MVKPKFEGAYDALREARISDKSLASDLEFGVNHAGSLTTEMTVSRFHAGLAGQLPQTTLRDISLVTDELPKFEYPDKQPLIVDFYKDADTLDNPDSSPWGYVLLERQETGLLSWTRPAAEKLHAAYMTGKNPTNRDKLARSVIEVFANRYAGNPASRRALLRGRVSTLGLRDFISL